MVRAEPLNTCTAGIDTIDEQGSGLDRIGSGLKPTLAGSGLDQTAIFSKLADHDWIGLRIFLLF